MLPNLSQERNLSREPRPHHGPLQNFDILILPPVLQHPKRLAKHQMPRYIRSEERKPLHHISRSISSHLLSHPRDGQFRLVSHNILPVRSQLALRERPCKQPSPLGVLLWISHHENARRTFALGELLVPWRFEERGAGAVDLLEAGDAGDG